MKKVISEVHNIDCIEFMKTLPDKFFSIAICDPPYGDASDDGGGGWNRFGERFNRYKPQFTPPEQKIAQNRRNVVQKVRPYNRFGGWFNRYKPTAERQEDARPFLDSRTNEDNANIEYGRIQPTKIHTNGGRTQKYYPTEKNEEGKPKYGTIDWDVAPSQEYWDELFRVSENQIIWGGNYFSLPRTRCFVVWEKLSISENFSMAMAEYAWTSFNDNAKVFRYAPQGTAKEPRIHACQKPIALYQFLLKHFAKEDDKIFDSHMGSQSSRIAAYGMGYDYWGCEIDEIYFKQGCERFERLCHGIEKLKDGRSVKQLSIFDEI